MTGFHLYNMVCQTLSMERERHFLRRKRATSWTRLLKVLVDRLDRSLNLSHRLNWNVIWGNIQQRICGTTSGLDEIEEIQQSILVPLIKSKAWGRLRVPVHVQSCSLRSKREKNNRSQFSILTLRRYMNTGPVLQSMTHSNHRRFLKGELLIIMAGT